MSYARFYDSLNNLLPSDRPDDDIIEDDAALDRWYQGYLREQAIKSGKKTDRSMQAEIENIPKFKGK